MMIRRYDLSTLYAMGRKAMSELITMIICCFRQLNHNDGDDEKNYMVDTPVMIMFAMAL